MKAILMRNKLRMTDYDTPSKEFARDTEWLIVEKNNDRMKIADAKKKDCDGPDKLRNFEPQNTMWCLKLFKENGRTYYSIVDELPARVRVQDRFFSAEGFAMTWKDRKGRLHLRAGGRHNHNKSRFGWSFDAKESRA